MPLDTTTQGAYIGCIRQGDTDMQTIYLTFSMDYTSESEYAQRSDGQWFSRYQYRDSRYGYKWSAWRATSLLPERASKKGERKVRLPKH